MPNAGFSRPCATHIFRDLASLNRAIAAQVKKINSRPYADGTGENRYSRFESVDLPHPPCGLCRTDAGSARCSARILSTPTTTSPSTGTSTRCPTSMSARRSMCADRRRDLQATRSPTGVDSGTAGNICSRCPPSRTAPARSMGSSRIGMTFSTCPRATGTARRATASRSFTLMAKEPMSISAGMSFRSGTSASRWAIRYRIGPCRTTAWRSGPA